MSQGTNYGDLAHDPYTYTRIVKLFYYSRLY